MLSIRPRITYITLLYILTINRNLPAFCLVSLACRLWDHGAIILLQNFNCKTVKNDINKYKMTSYSKIFLYVSIDKTQVFCEILIQRPLARETIHLPSKLTEKDLEYMRQRAANHFDIIMQVLKEMPRQLLLIIRYYILLVKYIWY